MKRTTGTIIGALLLPLILLAGCTASPDDANPDSEGSASEAPEESPSSESEPEATEPTCEFTGEPVVVQNQEWDPVVDLGADANPLADVLPAEPQPACVFSYDVLNLGVTSVAAIYGGDTALIDEFGAALEAAGYVAEEQLGIVFYKNPDRPGSTQVTFQEVDSGLLSDQYGVIVDGEPLVMVNVS